MAAGFALAAVSIVVLGFYVRELEARVGAGLAPLVTGHPAAAVPGSDFFYALLGTRRTFGLTITYECTSAVLIAPVLAIGALLSLGRRVAARGLLLGTFLASAVLFVLNLVRIEVITWATAHFGQPGFTWSHVIVGSGITLAAYVAAIAVLVVLARRPASS